MNQRRLADFFTTKGGSMQPWLLTQPDVFDGSRVEAMIEDGLRIVRGAIETYKPVAILAAYSGGDDSVVSTHFACANFDAIAIHMLTSIGLIATQYHVQGTARQFNWNLKSELAPVVGCPNKHRDGRPFDRSLLPGGRWLDGWTAYEEFALNFGFPGAGKKPHQRMYQRLKERPLVNFIRTLRTDRKDKVLIISGIRQDESAIRAGYQRDTHLIESRVWVNPFYWHTSWDFEAYRQEFGLPRNPVKARIGISGECLCGCFASPGEREAIAKVEPSMGRYLDDLECRVRANGHTWGWGESPPAKASNKSLPGQMSLLDLIDRPQDTMRPMCVGCARRSD